MTTVDTVPDRHVEERPLAKMVIRTTIPIVLVALLIAGTLTSSRFLTFNNFVNLVNSAAIIGIVAVGMTYVLVVGGFVDLSVPATLATAGIVTLTVGDHVPVIVAAAAGITAAALGGIINGVLIGLLDLNPVVTTLGTNVAILGAAQALVGGDIVYTPLGSGVANVVNGSFLGIPAAVIAFAVVAIVGGFVLQRTVFGRRVFATGGNLSAAQVAGVRPRRAMASVFVLSAVCAGVAGALLSLKLGSVRPGIGAGYEFDAITAVVVGGTSLFGGSGTVLRTVGGLLIVALTTNILTLGGVPTPTQGLIKGVVIIAAVALDVAIRRRRRS